MGARAESTASARRWKSSNEVDALDVEKFVEVIVIGNANLITVWVLQVLWTFAALLGVISAAGICKRKQKNETQFTVICNAA